eukprot:3627774-Karenia_brevis.AAC.1
MLKSRQFSAGPSYECWLVRARRCAIATIRKTGTSIAAEIFKRHWTFAGHLARSTDPLCIAIVNFRNTEWIEANRVLHHRNPNRVWNRQGGTQQFGWDHHLYMYTEMQTLGPWHVLALDRKAWKSHVSEFVDFMIHTFGI